MCKTTISFFLFFLFIILISNIRKRGKLYLHPPNYSIVLVRVNKRFLFSLPHEFFNFLEKNFFQWWPTINLALIVVKTKILNFKYGILVRTFKDQQIYQKNILVRYIVIAKIAIKNRLILKLWTDLKERLTSATWLY